MKGVVLWIAPDRLALARATNTNEAALISARALESSANPVRLAQLGRCPGSSGLVVEDRGLRGREIAPRKSAIALWLYLKVRVHLQERFAVVITQR